MKYIFMIWLCFVAHNALGQTINEPSDNYVRDPILYKKLSVFLLENAKIHTKDSTGKFIPFSQPKLEEMYADVMIIAKNLRFDTISIDKSILGIYKFRYAGISEPPWLYFKYKDHIEFVCLNEKDLDVDKILKRIHRYFRKYPSFTEKEKVMMVKGTMQVVFDNIYGEYGW